MSPNRCRISTVGRLARIELVSDWGGSGDALDLRATWPLLQLDDDVIGVIVLARPTRGEREPPLRGEAGDRICRIGPKTNGLLKPIGVAVAGPIRDDALQLVAEADVVVATPESSFGDTSAAQGALAVHAFALGNQLPRWEVTRMALGGEKAGVMSSQRAAQLKLVDVVVPSSRLEAELADRITRLLPG